MNDRRGDTDASTSALIRKLGITDRFTGQERAQESSDALQSAGRRVLASLVDNSDEEYTVFCGLLARAQGLHERAVAAIGADNPYAAFTLLRAYAENAAAILYVKDHPSELDKFWHDPQGRGVRIGKITTHAASWFGNFNSFYSALSKYAHPMALSLLTSHRFTEGPEVGWSWSSEPAFRSEREAILACAWVVQVAEATARLLLEFAVQFGLLAQPSSASDVDHTT